MTGREAEILDYIHARLALFDTITPSDERPQIAINARRAELELLLSALRLQPVHAR